MKTEWTPKLTSQGGSNRSKLEDLAAVTRRMTAGRVELVLILVRVLEMKFSRELLRALGRRSQLRGFFKTPQAKACGYENPRQL
jgi:hypothetical protein